MVLRIAGIRCSIHMSERKQLPNYFFPRSRNPFHPSCSRSQKPEIAMIVGGAGLRFPCSLYLGTSTNVFELVLAFFTSP